MKRFIPLLSCIFMLVACSGDKQQPAASDQPAMPPSSVILVQPEVGDMQEVIVIAGSLVASQSAIISTEIDGILEKIHVADGETVEEGILLFSMDSATLLAGLQHAEATVVLRKEEKKRAESLFQRNVVSQHEVDEATALLLTAEADRDFAQARLEKAAIKAPFSGKTGIRKVNVGNYVKAGTGLINLVRLNPLFLDFSVPGTALSSVEEGMLVEVEVPAVSGQVLKARVIAMEPELDVSTRSLGVRAELDNKDGKLLSGAFARVRLPIKKQEKVLWLPESAIFYEGKKRLVVIDDNGKALHKEVEVVSFQNGKAAVISGITEQDKVVSAGHHKVPFDGMPLMPVPLGKPASPADSEPAEVTR